MRVILLTGCLAVAACAPSDHELSAEAVEQLRWRANAPVEIEQLEVKGGTVCGRAEIHHAVLDPEIWWFAYTDGRLAYSGGRGVGDSDAVFDRCPQ